METIRITRYDSPAGEMLVGAYRDSICICDWAHSRRRAAIDRRIARYTGAGYADGRTDVTDRAISELEEYFAGKRRVFTIPLLFTGTEFQHRVWTGLMRIPYGITISYGELARRIGNPNAVRAVASANATNPLSILVPCHRVIGHDNRLTGDGGGLEIKQMLLTLEAERMGG